MKIDIKARAERNGKIRRTIAQIEKTIASLERVKEEYLQKAADAKSRGDAASYSLCKSAINTTLTQIKRSKEMLLNIEITSELQKMGETNADFLTGMSVVAKRISKINKQSDFVKLQKEIQKALSGMEEAQAGLDVFLQNTDAQFAAISQSQGALTDKQIDELVDGKVSERELLMDAQLAGAKFAADSLRETSNARREVLAEGSGTPERTASVKNDNVIATAKPFPMPDGAFRFEPKKSSVLDSRILEEDRGDFTALSDVYEKSECPTLVIGQSADSQVYRVPLREAPVVLIGGVIGSGKTSFLRAQLCSLAVSHTAEELRFTVFDIDGDEYIDFDGTPYMAANVITDRACVKPTFDALNGEIDRRYDAMSAVGARDIYAYNNRSETKLPFIVVVFDEYTDAVSSGDEHDLLRLLRHASDAGVYFLLATRNVDGTAVTPAVLSAARLRLAMKMPKSCAEKFGAVEAADCERAGCLAYTDFGGTKVCRAPYISAAGVSRIAAIIAEDRI